MKTSYDEVEDALFLRFADVAIVESEELRPGIVLDLDADGRTVATEILNASAQLAGDLAVPRSTAA